MIIAKYLAKEILQSLVAVTLVLLFIFSCNEFVRYLHFVATGKYAAWVLVHIVLLQVPILLGLLLPLGMYLGILMGYGRLYHESEMTVLSACGFSDKQLIKVTLGFAALVMIFVAILSLWVQPIMTLRSREVLAMAKSGSILQTILPGRFQSVNNGKRVYYIKKLSHDRRHMGDVFMAQRVMINAQSSGKKKEKSNKSKLGWQLIYSNSAKQSIDEKSGNAYLIMQDGHMYKGAPGEDNYQVVKYKNYGVLVSSASFAGLANNIDTQSTMKLIPEAFHNLRAAAELQWRLSAPISVILLALLALPLSRLKPRQGKFSRILPAIFIYIIYANLMFAGREWVESGVIPAWLGLWWVHILLLAFALYLIYRQSRSLWGKKHA